MPARVAERRTTDAGVTERRCTMCREFKPENARSYAVKRHRKTDGAAVFYGRCRVCESNRVSAYQAEQAATNPAWVERRQGIKRFSAELERIDRRLEAELEGVPLPEVEPTSGAESGVRLPSQPLMRQIMRAIEREEAYYRANDPLTREHLTGGADDRICRSLRLEPRTLRAWKVGERSTVDFDVADRTLSLSPWLWWEVYDESTVRQRLEVGLYRLRKIKCKRGRGSYMARERSGTRWYGDFGPDRVALAEVEAAFTGSPMPERPEPEDSGCPECGVKPRRLDTPARTIEDYRDRKPDRRGRDSPMRRTDGGQWLPEQEGAVA